MLFEAIKKVKLITGLEHFDNIVGYIQYILGVTAGDHASQFFSGYDIEDIMGMSEGRLQKLLYEYARSEISMMELGEYQ